MQDRSSLYDFENTRQKLIADLKGAEEHLGVESHELFTVKAALKYIEEEIAALSREGGV